MIQITLSIFICICINFIYPSLAFSFRHLNCFKFRKFFRINDWYETWLGMQHIKNTWYDSTTNDNNFARKQLLYHFCLLHCIIRTAEVLKKGYNPIEHYHKTAHWEAQTSPLNVHLPIQSIRIIGTGILDRLAGPNSSTSWAKRGGAPIVSPDAMSGHLTLLDCQRESGESGTNAPVHY